MPWASLIPILEDIVGWDRIRIRAFFESQGLLIQEWDKINTDCVTCSPTYPPESLETRLRVEGASA